MSKNLRARDAADGTVMVNSATDEWWLEYSGEKVNLYLKRLSIFRVTITESSVLEL